MCIVTSLLDVSRLCVRQTSSRPCSYRRWPMISCSRDQTIAIKKTQTVSFGALGGHARTPGLKYVERGKRAQEWSTRLGRLMHEVTVETDAFHVRLVFADVRYSFEGNDERAVLGKKNYPLPAHADDLTSDGGVR